jgi:hypothetical protein
MCLTTANYSQAQKLWYKKNIKYKLHKILGNQFQKKQNKTKHSQVYKIKPTEYEQRNQVSVQAML